MFISIPFIQIYSFSVQLSLPHMHYHQTSTTHTLDSLNSWLYDEERTAKIKNRFLHVSTQVWYWLSGMNRDENWNPESIPAPVRGTRDTTLLLVQVQENNVYVTRCVNVTSDCTIDNISWSIRPTTKLILPLDFSSFFTLIYILSYLFRFDIIAQKIIKPKIFRLCTS